MDIDTKLPKIVCIVGPTSSGKTELGLRAARQFDGEVINADARQCYRTLNIGTGKPPGTHKEADGEEWLEVDGIRHHLMDVFEPTETVTASRWRESALVAINNIHSRGRLPIIVGGTGLYIRGLVDHLLFQPAPSEALRADLQAKSLDELVSKLRVRNPALAAQTDLRNPRRVSRALEILLEGDAEKREKRFGPPLVEALQVGIRFPREVLFERIDASVRRMFAEGWVEEVRELLASGISPLAPAMSSIGYPLIVRHLNGEMNLEETIHACQRDVRRYAKRQETWFRRDARIRWFEKSEQTLEEIAPWVGFVA